MQETNTSRLSIKSGKGKAMDGIRERSRNSGLSDLVFGPCECVTY